MMKMRFDGGKDVEKALADLPTVTAKGVARRILKKAGQMFADAGAANAKRKTGGLQDSYAVSTRLNKRQRRMSRKKDPVEVYVGPTDPAGLQLEFGNEHQAPQPHLRPAFDGLKFRVLDLIGKWIWEDIDKTAARHARKMAKLKGR